MSDNNDKCPFCNSYRRGKTEEEMVVELMKRVEANDAGAICVLGNSYHNGRVGLQQDRTKANELFAKAAELGYSKAHNRQGNIYYEGGDMKKAKFHFEAAAMAGHEKARSNLGGLEAMSGNMEKAVKHFKIAASAGDYYSMHHLGNAFEKGAISRESIDSILTAYNSSCAEMRSEARDDAIQSLYECQLSLLLSNVTN